METMECTDFCSVENEYVKDCKLKMEDIRMLEEWVEKQPHLPKITERRLIHFLQSCYFSNEAAKSCIEIFYSARTHCPEFFTRKDPVKYSSELLDLILYAPLPARTPEGFQIVFGRLLDCNSDHYVMANQIKAFEMSIMLMLHQEGTAPGQVLLYDMTGITFGHFTKFNVVQLKKFFVYLQEGMPIRLKCMYFINIPSFMDKILALVKPFMKKELWDSMQLFTDTYEDLYKSVPKECMPKDYGGSAPSIQELTERRNKNIKNHAEFFLAEESAKTDESKRVGKPKTSGDVFGVEGTFKRLDID